MNEIWKNLLEIYKKDTKLTLISKSPTPNPAAAPKPVNWHFQIDKISRFVWICDVISFKGAL